MGDLRKKVIDLADFKNFDLYTKLIRNACHVVGKAPLGSRPERPNERLDVELLLLLRGEPVDGVAEVDEVEQSDGGLHVPLGVRLLVVAPRVARVEQGAVLIGRRRKVKVLIYYSFKFSTG